MNKDTYSKIEGCMLENCGESVHDCEHIYRVLYTALDIAQHEKSEVDTDILIAACLLHDIGRAEELKNKKIDHAVYGSEMAYKWLVENGFDNLFAQRVSECIKTHRYRGNNIPRSIEAKILFDADKIDAAGYMGIARTLMYKGIIGEPLYITDNGTVSDGTDNSEHTFFREYVFKLSKVYDRLFTDRAKETAERKRAAAQHFYSTLYSDLDTLYSDGKESLNSYFDRL